MNHLSTKKYTHELIVVICRRRTYPVINGRQDSGPYKMEIDDPDFRPSSAKRMRIAEISVEEVKAEVVDETEQHAKVTLVTEVPETDKEGTLELGPKEGGVDAPDGGESAPAADRVEMDDDGIVSASADDSTATRRNLKKKKKKKKDNESAPDDPNTK